MLEAHDQAQNTSVSKFTLETFLGTWLDGIRVAPKTLHGYRWSVSLAALDAYRAQTLDRITPQSIQAMIEQVSAEQGASSALALYRALSAAFAWGIRKGKCDDLPSNPMLRVDRPKCKRREPVVPSPAAINDVIAACEPGFAALLRVAIATGARRSELAALKWSDIDYEQRTVLIARAIDTAPGPLIIKPTKSDRSRTVSVDDTTLAILRRHAGDQIAAPANGWIWSRNADGKTPIRPDRINALWRKARAHVPEVAEMRFHHLRHAGITWLIMSGADPRTVAARAGHSSPNITLAVYTAHVAAADRSAADTMGLLLGASIAP